LDQKWAIRNAASAAAVAAAVTTDAPNTGVNEVAGGSADVPEPTATTSKAPSPAVPVAEAKIEIPTSAEVSEAVEATLAKLIIADRNRLIASVFWICDLNHDGFLSESEMLSFARHIGFEDSEEVWTGEYIQLCKEFKISHEIGIDRKTFHTMITDTSPTGCFCSDQELRKFLEFLGKLSTEASSSSSTLDSSGTVRCNLPRIGVDKTTIKESSGGVAGATRGSAAVAAPPGSSSVAATTGDVSVVVSTDESKKEDEIEPKPLSRDRTPRRTRRSPSSSTSSSPPAAPPPSPVASVDPSFVARVWDTIAEHLDSN
jgi:hypothetical protein